MAINALRGLRSAVAADYPTVDAYGQVRLPESLAPDTGDSELNAIQRASNARRRLLEQQQVDDDNYWQQVSTRNAGDPNPYPVNPMLHRRQLSAMGNSLGDQLVESQNEIADTGQKTRMNYAGSKGPRNSPSFMGLQRAMMAQKEQELRQWAGR